MANAVVCFRDFLEGRLELGRQIGAAKAPVKTILVRVMPEICSEIHRLKNYESAGILAHRACHDKSKSCRYEFITQVFYLFVHSRLEKIDEMSIILATMKHPLFTASSALLLGFNVPTAVAENADVNADTVGVIDNKPESVGNELLQVTNEMWFLLSAITDRGSADAAVARLDELITRSEIISNSLFAADGLGQDLEALDMLHYRIAESLEELHSEFVSLARARCYGSSQMIACFHRAVEAGLIDADVVDGLSVPGPPLTEREARLELARFKNLEAPDREVVAVLQCVQDARSADNVVERVLALSKRLNELRPDDALVNRSFSPASERKAQDAYAPIEPLLWNIRSEIVRIASLPGYEDSSYDKFSDALDLLYESLGATHSQWFGTVFDECFRSDLHEALRENATTSN